MTLLHLPIGSRFKVREAPELTGTLLAVSECRASVRYDTPAEYVHYETAAGKTVEFYRASRPIDVTPYLEVVRS